MDYIPHKKSEVKKMLEVIGVKSIEDLFSDIPENLKKTKFNLRPGLSQLELLRLGHALAHKNADPFEYISFLGAGAYEHSIPALVGKITSLPGFLTSYTPYQAEVSQGTLKSIFEYQSLICELTGLEESNASLYDGATAVVEAAVMALNITERKEILIAETVNPQYRKVLQTSIANLGVQISELPRLEGITNIEKLEEKISEKTAAVILQQPNFFGCLEEMAEAEKLAHRQGALLIISANPVSLGILKRPGEYGADIAVGEGQPLGIPLNFGGPYLGFFASRRKWLRQFPGRLVGPTKDGDFTLILQTREQHIRRERASSNICTNSGLNAIAFSVVLSLLGNEGLKTMAQENIKKAHFAQKLISEIPGLWIKFSNPYFNEFVIECDSNAKELQKKLLQDKIIAGLSLDRFYPELKNCLLFCVTETKTEQDIERLVRALSVKNNSSGQPLKPLKECLEEKYLSEKELIIPKLTESEAEKRWTQGSESNYCVDSNFYPLGSCTMKLNPKENEAIASSHRFTMLHPYLPKELTQGTLQIMYETQEILSEICGMHRFSLQPSAGAHGESTSLLVIGAFHKKQGNNRKIILIPDSAHGTNPASATRAGFQAVTVKSTQEGEIDLNDLRQKANGNTASLMITLPNTLGIFEKNILEITDIVHEAGGLVYMDGANMNALVGICKPGDMGVDILHLNLHKTFSAPHGGGGPGSGPIGVTKELASFMPVPLVEKKGKQYFLNYDLPDSIGRVTNFYGNINVVLKAYLYLRAIGKDGLKKVAQYAVFNANYLRVLLKNNYTMPYDRTCMHEFVISAPNALLAAKRILDYNFHAPTIYFPLIVPEAMMIEPTETESKKIIDEFAKAMIKIKNEFEKHPEVLEKAPRKTPVKRVDQISADRNPTTKYQKPS